MNRHRIFIAINISESAKKRLWDYQKKWSELPVRWTYKQNLHITLLFLGYLTDQELLDVIRDAEKVITNCEPFQLTLNKIIYGPPKKMPPKMVWATGEPSEELKTLQRNLEENVYSEPFPADEKREKGNYFAPHITLGRIKSWEFKSIEPEEVPEINEDISITIPVESIEIMESELKKCGPEYIILESFQLKI